VSKKLGSQSSGSDGNINDEGENIEEEDNDRNNTLSYIRCKPSIMKNSTNMFPQGDKTAVQMKIQQSISNRVHGGRFGGQNKSLGTESFEDVYLFEVFHSWDKKLRAANKSQEDSN